MIGKWIGGICAGIVSASLIHGSFDSGTDVNIKHLATAGVSITSLLAMLLVHNLAKKPQVVKEADYCKIIADMDECYDKAEKLVSRERNIVYNREIKNKEGKIIGRLKEYTIHTNSHSWKANDFKKYCLYKGYPLKPIIEIEEL